MNDLGLHAAGDSRRRERLLLGIYVLLVAAVATDALWRVLLGPVTNFLQAFPG